MATEAEALAAHIVDMVDDSGGVLEGNSVTTQVWKALGLERRTPEFKEAWGLVTNGIDAPLAVTTSGKRTIRLARRELHGDYVPEELPNGDSTTPRRTRSSSLTPHDVMNIQAEVSDLLERLPRRVLRQVLIHLVEIYKV